MPVQEARNDAQGKDDAHGVTALKRRAIADVKDLLHHADETCRACLIGGTAKRSRDDARDQGPNPGGLTG